LGITQDSAGFKKTPGTKRKRVHFNDDEIIINPEDVDPSIGRFRNLVQTTVLPTSSKRLKFDFSAPPSLYHNPTSPTDIHKNILHPTILSPSLYGGLPPTSMDTDHTSHGHTSSTPDDLSFNPFGSKLGMLLPNPAPEIAPIVESQSTQNKTVQIQNENMDIDDEPRKKKKYAKEAWPKLARKPSFIKTN
jgi:nuclear inhibitor of protein phosphatase 1